MTCTYVRIETNCNNVFNKPFFAGSLSSPNLTQVVDFILAQYRHSFICGWVRSSKARLNQEYIIKEKRVSNFAIANVECMRKVT